MRCFKAVTCKSLWLLVCAAGALATPVYAQVSLRLEPRDCPAVGEELRVDIVAGDTTAQLVGAQFFLAYDPEALEYVDFEPTSPFGRQIGDVIIIPEIGHIQLAVGVDQKQGAVELGDTVLGTFVVRPLVGECAPLRLDWIDQPDLPNQLTTLGGLALQPAAEALTLVVHEGPIEAQCPADTTLISAGGPLDIEWDPVTLDGACPNAVIVERSCVAIDDTGAVSQLDGTGGPLAPGTWSVACSSSLDCGASATCSFELTVEVPPDEEPEPPVVEDPPPVAPPAPPFADLQVDLELSTAALAPGELLIITTTAEHLGGTSTSGADLELEFGPFLDIVTRSGRPVVESGSAVWRLPPLEQGQRSTRSVVCRLNELGASGTVDQIQVSAYVDHTGDDPTMTNNDARMVVDIAGLVFTVDGPQFRPPIPTLGGPPPEALCGACGSTGGVALAGLVSGLMFMRRGRRVRRR